MKECVFLILKIRFIYKVMNECVFVLQYYTTFERRPYKSIEHGVYMCIRIIGLNCGSPMDYVYVYIHIYIYICVYIYIYTVNVTTSE